jgi:hypothetical protein
LQLTITVERITVSATSFNLNALKVPLAIKPYFTMRLLGVADDNAVLLVGLLSDVWNFAQEFPE